MRSDVPSRFIAALPLFVLLLAGLYIFHAAPVSAAGDTPGIVTYTTTDSASGGVSDVCPQPLAEALANAKNVPYKARLAASMDNVLNNEIFKNSKQVSIKIQTSWCSFSINSTGGIIWTVISALIDAISGAGFTTLSALWDALAAVIEGIITQLVQQIINAICQAIVDLVAAALSYICIPLPDLLTISIPDFVFPNMKAKPCDGQNLFTVTGGPTLPTPPGNYSNIPFINYTGRTIVIP